MRFEIQVEGKSLEELTPYAEALAKIAKANIKVTDEDIQDVLVSSPEAAEKIDFFYVSGDSIRVGNFFHWGTERRPYDDVAELSSVLSGETVFLITANEVGNESFLKGGQFVRDAFKNGRPAGRWTAKPLEWEDNSIF